MIMMVGTYVFLLLHYTEDYWKANEAIKELPTSLMVLCRTFLAIIMHILLDVDIKQGLNMMKFASNHTWKFRNWYLAFSIGFVQLSLAIVAEYMAIHIILSVDTYIDAVKDFVALMVVNDFDNYFFSYLNKEDIYKLITQESLQVGSMTLSLNDLLRIEITTSYRPDANEFDA